ncbi:MAG: carboxypeptidase-like regulatory domain-containing protein, partial [Muribaculaceae bacterium]|nr:carboxypeptidase-like regulatory domain-containing protein [Muribaculaceae bacterium]
MRRKLFMLLTLLAVLPALADTGVCGVVIDSRTGQPIPGATILLDNQGNTVTTGPNGDFSITDAQPGKDYIYVLG